MECSLCMHWYVDSLSYLCCGLLANYLEDDKIGLLMYADNRIEVYLGRISRIIGRKFSARLMLEVAQSLIIS